MNLIAATLLLVLSFTFANAVRGQGDERFSAELRSIRQYVAIVQRDWALSKDLKAEAQSIIRTVEASDRLNELNGDRGPSSEYRDMLQPYLATLKEYGEKGKGKADARLSDAIRELNEDLRVKLQFAKSLKGGFFSDIDVVIETVVSGRPKSGYEVWFVPKGWKRVVERHQRFDNLSTPSLKNLPPGNYFIWAKKGAYTSELIAFSFGFDGQTKRRIDIEVLEN